MILCFKKEEDRFRLATLKEVRTYIENYFSVRHKNMQKHNSPMCMLLIQLASMNVFYSMRKLEGIIFHKGLSLL